MTVRNNPITRETIRDGLGLAAVGVAAGLTFGAAAVPAAVARGYVSRKAINAGADVLAKTLIK